MAEYPNLQTKSAYPPDTRYPVVAKVSYSKDDHFIHLTLWCGDYCMDRQSMVIDKFLTNLQVPFQRNFKLSLELDEEQCGEVS